LGSVIEGRYRHQEAEASGNSMRKRQSIVLMGMKERRRQYFGSKKTFHVDASTGNEMDVERGFHLLTERGQNTSEREGN